MNSSPLQSLQYGNWFKLICGASYQHLPAVRNLTFAYTLAGADCIDIAADPAVIAVAREAMVTASHWVESATVRGFPAVSQPLLMVSFNDGEDPHFRKAEFDSTACPSDCWRPCETVCPADAITFNDPVNPSSGGVRDPLCYGCGRCIPVCPSQIISTRSIVSTPENIAPLVLSAGVDAIEIHTQVGRVSDFKRLWYSVQPWINRLKLVAISCPDGGDLIDYLRTLYEIISPLPCPLIWQTDGRPMSGDIGAGTTTACLKLGQKVLAANLPGYVQLAGGTNHSTVAKLKSMGLLASSRPQNPSKLARPGVARVNLLKSRTVAGVAYGSYARVLLSPLLEKLESKYTPEPGSSPNNDVGLATTAQPSALTRLETNPELLWQTVSLAHSLVAQLKGFQSARG
ncbi:iron-sulfur binding domain protein [Lyngbya aestuarii BL J]|uniref:Iron-sulfur binding domain protein n=1 Tax=Lyngbya aestuarii BL J TaxID=1348334 RepID=U7QBJ3_9CYAN|nr:LdpA C-terminal domain-containing domain [Lyngbya aestuarii]ERT04106.1 iron-sulfur binding domain protein [Lyngbya aestuarii BL J]